MRMMPRTVLLALTVLVAGCGGGDVEEEPGFDERVGTAADATGDQANAGPAAEAEGEVSFMVDGREHSFDHIVDDETYSTGMATSVVARPGAGAPESFRLTVMSIDLEDYEYPMELPPEEAGTSVQTGMMMVGFGFIDEEGREWSGPGRLRVESFEDDLLVAAFDGVEIPHTDGEMPAIVLRDGRIRARF